MVKKFFFDTNVIIHYIILTTKSPEINRGEEFDDKPLILNTPFSPKTYKPSFTIFYYGDKRGLQFLKI